MIQLNLPLSATALREGAEFLTKLSQLADVIRAEVYAPEHCNTVGELIQAPGQTVVLKVPDGHVAEIKERPVVDPATGVNVVAAPGITASAQEVGDGVIDVTVAPAGGDHDAPLAAAGGTTPEDAIVAAANQQFETVVIGHERNPDYTGELAGWEQAALEQSGWDVPGLLAAGYLREVTEQRPLAVAPTAPQAPTPPAPSAPPAPAAAGGEVELDVDGLPWDARIHSNAAERKAATGKWKTRKNLAPGYKEQIEAELRGVPTAPAATPAPAPAPSAPSPAATVAPAPTPSTAGAMTFPQFVQWAMGHTKAGRCNQTDVQLAVQGVGLKDVPALSQNPGKIAEVMAALKASKGIE